MRQHLPFSDQTYHRLLKLGLSPDEVERLMALLARRAGAALGARLDEGRWRDGLDRAALGGDPVAIKLCALPRRDRAVAEVAMAYGALQSGA